MNAIQKAYVTEEGKPAKHIWMIEDEEVFDKANADFSALHPEKEEYKKIIVAHIIGLQNEIGYVDSPQYQILQKLLKIIKEV